MNRKGKASEVAPVHVPPACVRIIDMLRQWYVEGDRLIQENDVLVDYASDMRGAFLTIEVSLRTVRRRGVHRERPDGSMHWVYADDTETYSVVVYSGCDRSEFGRRLNMLHAFIQGGGLRDYYAE